mmetsp:Transcript_12681/g.21148  ORF Transcript_12681/g.21148 Transcript_12681/m.21148 type:complete len:472 (-) Transcript_12681:449-1864(-)
MPSFRSRRRRHVTISLVLLSLLELSTPLSISTPPPPTSKILLLGASGFLGQEIVQQAKDRPNIELICTSRSGKDGAVVIDLTAPDAEEKIAELAKGCTGVISTVGSLSGTSDDRVINAATSAAARGASSAGTQRFVAIGNNPRVRRLSKSVPFLKDYATGKEESERVIRELFGTNACIVQPCFVYGGDKFGVSPPRVASSVGRLAEEVLGLYPIQALSRALPDSLGVPLEAPTSVESVAAASLNVALGICEGYDVLDSKDSIAMAAKSHRPRGCINEDECSIEEEEETQRRRDEIKRMLTNPVDSDGSHDPIALMEELELLRPSSTKPAYDESLNSRWRFVLSKSDVGTDILKQLQTEEGFSPLQIIFAVRDVYMKISQEQRLVEIVLESTVLGVDVDVTLSTSLMPMAYDDESDGVLFVERFEGVNFGGIDLALPNSWRGSRYLEISYLDDTMVIARGNSGEPHFLLRGD